jgi:hypothetical protein
LLTALAFAGVVGSFVLTIRDLYRFSERFCGGAEGGANCRAIANYFAQNDIAVFAVFATMLAVLVLLQYFRPAGR